MTTENLLNLYIHKVQHCFLCRCLLDRHKIYNEVLNIGQNDDKCLSYSFPAFVVRILLEIPKLKLEDQSIEPNLVTCEPCCKAIQQGWKLYLEILETTKRFRTVQKKVVNIFKTRSSGVPDNPEDKAEEPKDDDDLFFKQCEQFANENSFNCFELPFIVRDIMTTSPSPKSAKSPSISESLDVKIEVDEDQTEIKDSQQEALLFLPKEPDHDTTKIIENIIKEEQLSEIDDHSMVSSSQSEEDTSDSEAPRVPVKNKKRRIQKSPKLNPNQKANQGPRISKFDQLYPNYPHKLIARHSDGKFPCPEVSCQKCCNEKQKLQNHILIKHLGHLHKCTWPNCTRTFTMSLNLQNHLDRHKGTPRWKCKENPGICNESFYTKNQLHAHKQLKHHTTNQNPLICEICGKSFNYRDHLYVHRSTKHKSLTKTVTGSDEHRKKSKFELNHPNYVLRKDLNGKFSCPEVNCPKIYQLKRDIEDHIQTVHMNEKLYVCDWPKCKNKSFETYNYFKTHLATHKKGSKSGRRKLERKEDTQCPVQGCRLPFATADNLKKHMEKKHGGESGGGIVTQFICKYCGKGFHLKCKLDHHHEIHENEKTKPYKCEVCGKGFATMAYLKYHQKHTHKMKLEDERLGGLKN